MPVFLSRIRSVHVIKGVTVIQFTNGRRATAGASVQGRGRTRSISDLRALARSRRPITARISDGQLAFLEEPVAGRVMFLREDARGVTVGLHSDARPFVIPPGAELAGMRTLLRQARQNSSSVGLALSDNDVISVHPLRAPRVAGGDVRIVTTLPKRAPDDAPRSEVDKQLLRIGTIQCPEKPAAKPQGCIPFYAPAFGCQARAHAIYLKVKSQVECGKIWCFPKVDLISATPDGAVAPYEWVLHVAPVVRIDGAAEAMVIDVVLFGGDGLRSISQWQATLGMQHEYVVTSAAPYLVEKIGKRWRLTFDRKGLRTEHELQMIREIG